MDLGIASPINVVHTATVAPGGSMRVAPVAGGCVALVASSVPTRIKVFYEGMPVLAAFAAAGDTARIALSDAKGTYVIEATHWGSWNLDQSMAADIHVTLEAVKAAVAA